MRKTKVFWVKYILMSANLIKHLHLPKAPLSKGSCRRKPTEGLSSKIEKGDALIFWGISFLGDRYFIYSIGSVR